VVSWTSQEVFRETQEASWSPGPVRRSLERRCDPRCRSNLAAGGFTRDQTGVSLSD